MKSSSSNNLCSLYQKFLVFEEPAFKWAHISKAAKQHDLFDFQGQSEQFIAQKNNSANFSAIRLVNVLIAFEESTRFQPSALEKLASLDISKYLPASRVDYWQDLAQTSMAQAQLMTLAEIFLPDWQQIVSQLPQDDARIEFILDCASLLPNEQIDWPKAREVFQKCLRSHRHNLPGSFLPNLIILVEGMTERILLPYFANFCGLNLLDKGGLVVPAGGANQIARKYLHWQNSLKLPMFCLFDHDAEALAQSILPSLRKRDSVYVLADGEIEDLMPLDFLVNNINRYLSFDLLHDRNKPVLITDFDSSEKRTLILEKIWRQKELGKFEKVKFAQFVAHQTDKGSYSRDRISSDGKQMLGALARSISSCQIANCEGVL